jgi:hypothetical protein
MWPRCVGFLTRSSRWKQNEPAIVKHDQDALDGDAAFVDVAWRLIRKDKNHETRQPRPQDFD